ncbi:hypothetical protein ACP70R_019742 [Stipagrostis hirtigluma subsp. patula]
MAGGTSGGARMSLGRVPPGAGCRIDALPDDALLRVLSHLDAREAVRTCVLSRRWRHLWRSVPRINASWEEFEGMADTDEERDALFKGFVNRFLVLRNPVALDEFRLRYNLPDDSSDVSADSADANLWVRHALQCNARSVEVSIRDRRLWLDHSVFASECLLTSLELSHVILGPGFFRSLQRGCTKLERLILHDCAIDDIEIASQTLKVLVIDADCFFTYGGRAFISSPSLIHLDFYGDCKVPSLNNMESLVTASVSVSSSDIPVDDIHQFLMSLSGVKNLEFYYEGDMLKMDKDMQWCPKFNNLTILTLGEWCVYADFYGLTVFLQNSPNLVKLSLELEQGRISDHTSPGFTGELEERSFTCEHLRIVEIACSKGDPVRSSLEKFLHENGISSDRVNIVHWT